MRAWLKWRLWVVGLCRRITLSVALLVTLATVARSQPVVSTVEVRGVEGCRGCRITAVEVARIGRGGEHEHLDQWPQSMWQDRRGRIFVMQSNGHVLPMVFDSSGAFLRSLGREGTGPGELRNAAVVFGDKSDTTFIHDWGNGRLTILDPELHIVRQIPFARIALKATALSDGTILANAVTRDRARPGLPFQLFNRAGERVGVTGTGDIPMAPSTEIFFAYRVAAAREGGFWAVPLKGRHLIERWTTLTSVTVFRRTGVPWFVEFSTGPDRLNQASLVASEMRGVWEDSVGLVWTLIRVADPRGPSPRDTLRNPEGVYTVARNMAREYDTIVEVLDPRSGRLIASQRFDGLFNWALGNGRIGSVIEHPDGGIEIAILGLTLIRPR